MRTRPRDGFAILTVIWVMVAAAIVALAAQLAGRDSYNAGRNRVNAERAFWRARDCLAHARALIDAQLESTTDPAVTANVWRTLSGRIIADPTVNQPDCGITLEATGTRLDVNATSDSILLALFDEMGFASNAEAMVAALRDWTDSDSVAQPLGAEADWYAAQHRPLPRNGPLADTRELAYVRGFESAAQALDSVLTVEPGRISFPTASLAVLGAVPGFSQDALDRVAQIRATGEVITDLAAFASSLPPTAMDLMADHFDEISRIMTVDPDAWILCATGHSGHPDVPVTIELKLVRAANRAVPLRQRIDP